jgi:hypothetical protein
MRASPLPTRDLPEESPAKLVPRLPTVVVGSYKGGVWKTSIAVALAERLALAGLRVLLVTCDRQEDARSRLGVPPSAPLAATVARGKGSVTVVGARGGRAVELLYRSGPERLGLGGFDVSVLDTPPEEVSGNLPGVLLIATIDGADAARNLVTLLRGTPTSTDIILVRVQRAAPDEWGHDAGEIGEAARKEVRYLRTPLPAAAPVKGAHDAGRSVWELPRRGCTREYLKGIECLASVAWNRISPGTSLPPAPASGASSAYVPGWDDEDA